jgi:hypothetical protein
MEAETTCVWAGQPAAVKILLEAGEIILRGGLKRRLPVASLDNRRADNKGLHFTVEGQPVTLALPHAAAAKWLHKIETPPPTLAEKLGVSKARPTYVIGPVPDPALEVALNGAVTADGARCHSALAVVSSAAALGTVLTAHTALPAGTPIWIVHGKGRSAAFGEAPVRDAMRQAGFIDSKVTAVSSQYTATRYAAQKPNRT